MFAKSADSVAYATGKDEGSIRGGTNQDKKDMWRVGRDQELNVRVESCQCMRRQVNRMIS